MCTVTRWEKPTGYIAGTSKTGSVVDVGEMARDVEAEMGELGTGDSWEWITTRNIWLIETIEALAEIAQHLPDTRKHITHIKHILPTH